MISHETETKLITFKKNTAMFRDKITNKILGVIVYNPEFGRWRYISSEEYKKQGAENLYDL